MKVKEVLIVLRKNGFFTFQGRKVKATRPGWGYGVLIIFETSPVDFEFESYVWFPSQEDLEKIQKALAKSDELTHELLGRGWAGKKPFWKLEDFM